MGQWLFLIGVIIIRCLVYPPFPGMWIGIALFYGVAVVVYSALGGVWR